MPFFFTVPHSEDHGSTAVPVPNRFKCLVARDAATYKQCSSLRRMLLAVGLVAQIEAALPTDTQRSQIIRL